MIWVTVSSRSYFCWLYRASPSLAAKNIINLISVLTIWWCPCVESSLVLLEEGVCYDKCVLLAKLFSLLVFSLFPASFHISRPNLPVTPGVSWLPTLAFQSPIMKRTIDGVAKDTLRQRKFHRVSLTLPPLSSLNLTSSWKNKRADTILMTLTPYYALISINGNT